jgi:propanol-preferring alcohol dehydrogenase
MVCEPRQPLRFTDLLTQSPPLAKLARVAGCAVCRTDLHIVDGELPNPKLPLVPGHEIVGYVIGLGPGVEPFKVGDRIGIPWLGRTCGECAFCRSGRENLCDQARFTGYTLDGGYAEYVVADARFCFPLQNTQTDAEGEQRQSELIHHDKT